MLRIATLVDVVNLFFLSHYAWTKVVDPFLILIRPVFITFELYKSWMPILNVQSFGDRYIKPTPDDPINKNHGQKAIPCLTVLAV